jgi:hypothetical protein
VYEDILRINPVDAEAVEQALVDLRAAGDLEDVNEEDVRMEMLVALLRKPEVTIPMLKVACASLAGRTYIKEKLHVAPTDTIPHHHKKPRQRTSWWGGLVTEDED